MSINLDNYKYDSYKNLGQKLYEQNAAIDELLIEKYGIERVMGAYEEVLNVIGFSDTEKKRFPKMDPQEIVDKFFPDAKVSKYIPRPTSLDRRAELKAQLVDMVYSCQDGIVILSKAGPNIIATEESSKLHYEYLYRCFHEETSLRFCPMSWTNDDRKIEKKCTALMVKIPLTGKMTAEDTISLLRKMYGWGPMNIPVPSHYIIEQECLTLVYPIINTYRFDEDMTSRFFMYVVQRSIAKRLYAFDAYCEDLNFIQPIGDVPLYDVKFDHVSNEVKKTFIGWKKVDVVKESGEYCDYERIQQMVLPTKPIFWTSHASSVLAGKLGLNIINGRRALPTWEDIAKTRIEDLNKIRRYMVKMGIVSEDKIQTLYFHYLLNSLILYKRQDKASNAAAKYVHNFNADIDMEDLLPVKRNLLERFEYESENCKKIGENDISDGQDTSKMLFYYSSSHFYEEVGSYYPALSLNCMDHFDRKDYDWIRYDIKTGHSKQKEVESVYAAINVCDLKFGTSRGNKEVIEYLSKKNITITTKMVNYHRGRMRERNCYLPDLYTLELKGWDNFPMKKLIKEVAREMESLMPWSIKNRRENSKYTLAKKEWFNNESMFTDLDMLKNRAISNMVLNVLNNRHVTYGMTEKNTASDSFSWEDITLPASVSDAANKRLQNAVIIITKKLYSKTMQIIKKYNLSFRNTRLAKCNKIITPITA